MNHKIGAKDGLKIIADEENVKCGSFLDKLCHRMHHTAFSQEKANPVWQSLPPVDLVYLWFKHILLFTQQFILQSVIMQYSYIFVAFFEYMNGRRA